MSTDGRKRENETWSGRDGAKHGASRKHKQNNETDALGAHTLMVTSVLLPWFFIDMTDTLLAYASESAWGRGTVAAPARERVKRNKKRSAQEQHTHALKIKHDKRRGKKEKRDGDATQHGDTKECGATDDMKLAEQPGARSSREQKKTKAPRSRSNTHLGANLDGAQRGEQHDAHHNRGKASHCFAGGEKESLSGSVETGDRMFCELRVQG